MTFVISNTNITLRFGCKHGADNSLNLTRIQHENRLYQNDRDINQKTLYMLTCLEPKCDFLELGLLCVKQFLLEAK